MKRDLEGVVRTFNAMDGELKINVYSNDIIQQRYNDLSHHEKVNLLAISKLTEIYHIMKR